MKTNNSAMQEEQVDFLNGDFSQTVDELNKLSEMDTIQIELNEGLEEALKELDSLHDQFSKGDSARLLDLCKTTVIETITGQFGLAGMFINSQDGGNVTTAHNFEKGVTATESDQEKYEAYNANNDGSIKWKKVRDKVGYDKPLPKKRKETFNNQDRIIDEYTGKELPKDGRAVLDHVVSAKEIESNPKNHLFKTPEERAKMATNDKNLAWTNTSANSSKGQKKLKDWVDTPNPNNPNETNEERYGIDRKRAEKIDAEARKYIKTQITVAAAKKYSTELIATGGKDAGNMAAYSALGVVMRELTQAVFQEIHVTFQQRGKETLKEIFIRFKERIEMVIKDLKSKWKDILKGSFEAGLTAFLSNIVIFIINLFATTLKKLVSMIRAGFVSLCQAVKMLTNPPEGMDREEANYQALKILTAGLIGAASLGLSAGIEKLLQSIPGLQPLMMFPIPSFGKNPRTVSDILSFTISALAGGLLTTIALYFMDKCREAGKKDKLQIQLISQGGVVVQYKIAQTWCVLYDAYQFLEKKIIEDVTMLKETNNEIEESGKEAAKAVNDFLITVNEFEQKQKALTESSIKEGQ
jgi:5-methylcytosine-specific restriction endonuclease McrA